MAQQHFDVALVRVTILHYYGNYKNLAIDG